MRSRCAPGAEQNVVIIESDPHARVIGEIDRPSAMTLVHDEAIYVHDGRQYHADRLDWEELKAYVRPVDVDYFTDAHLAVELRVLEEWDGEEEPSARAHGEVAVTYLATIFKKIRLRTHENIGWGKVRLPQDDMHTAAWWLTLPSSEHTQQRDVEGTLLGLGELLRNVAPLLLMCDSRDLHLSTQVKSPHTGLPTIFLWESVPGGVGLSEQLHLDTERLLDMACAVTTDCPCGEGCPGCVGPPAAPGLGVKTAVVDALRTMTAARLGR